jgi:hypothetical protein
VIIIRNKIMLSIEYVDDIENFVLGQVNGIVGGLSTGKISLCGSKMATRSHYINRAVFLFLKEVTFRRFGLV